MLKLWVSIHIFDCSLHRSLELLILRRLHTFEVDCCVQIIEHLLVGDTMSSTNLLILFECLQIGFSAMIIVQLACKHFEQTTRPECSVECEFENSSPALTEHIIRVENVTLRVKEALLKVVQCNDQNVDEIGTKMIQLLESNHLKCISSKRANSPRFNVTIQYNWNLKQCLQKQNEKVKHSEPHPNLFGPPNDNIDPCGEHNHEGNFQQFDERRSNGTIDENHNEYQTDCVVIYEEFDEIVDGVLVLIKSEIHTIFRR
mmetsp:Transcript_11636/g.43735  ORF Transcript_11636/g.43735 Transcript_11636/m.43735 type:complete len:258 (+) Transcript_11636:3430-4203(+)